jgi:hypothetical protein
MIDIHEEFSLLVNVLENNSIEYALCGGLPVSYCLKEGRNSKISNREQYY